MKKTSILIAAIAISFGCQRIDAGHAGIKVNLYGDSKGVDNSVIPVAGMVWYNPLTTSVYEVPTYVQNAVYTHDATDLSRDNEEFRVTTKDGLVANFDVSLNYRTPDDAVINIFKKYRKPVQDLEKTIIRNYLRDAFNGTASKFTAENLYEKRAEFEKMSEDRIRQILEPEGFIIEQVVLLNELRLPKGVTDNINQKVAATQIAIRKQQEVAQARADADKSIEDARGKAESLIIQAKAEKEANLLRQQSLTPLLVQQQFVEKWNGVLPVYGQVPTLFKAIQ